MTDERQLWDRQDGETKRQFQAFTDYLLMGVNRAHSALHEMYVQQESSGAPPKPPTTSKTTINTWSHRCKWVERVNAYDEHMEQQQYVIEEKRRANMRETFFHREYQMLEELVTILETTRKYTSGVELKHDTEEGQKIIIAKSSPADIRALMDAHNKMAQLTRLIYGLPGEISEVRSLDLGSVLERAKQLREEAENDADGDTR